MQKVEIISPTILQSNQKYKLCKKKVCAYCRVSTDYEDQKSSYESQIKYYTVKINENPDWEFAGIYADEGISGTQAYNRDSFQRMIKDAEDGKIDLILVKSISRFGRNTVDILKYIRQLKALNVAIYFEEENINTLDMQGEVLIAILAALAQNGSSAISSSVIKGNQMKMKRGDLVGRYDCYGFRYDEEQENLVIVEEEAEIVRKVFDLYLTGLGTGKVAQKMNEEGYVTPRGKKWRDTTVSDMIKNQKYKGDLLQGQNYTVDPIEHIRAKNRGEREMYYARDHHIGIVDRVTWDTANEMLKQKSKKYNGDYAPKKYSTSYTFSSKIICGYCGETYIRWKRKIGKDNHDLITWICGKKKKKKNGMVPDLCDNLNYREETIEQVFVKAYSLLCKNNQKVIKQLLTTLGDVLSGNCHENELSKLQNQVNELDRKKSSLVDMKLNNLIDENMYLEKYKELNNKIDLLEEKINEYQQYVVDEKEIINRINRFKNIFESEQIFKEFSDNVFKALVDKIIIGKIEEDGTKNPNYIKFVLNTGTEIIDNLPEQKRRKKNDTNLSDQKVAQNNVSFYGDRKWYAWCTSYIS